MVKEPLQNPVLVVENDIHKRSKLTFAKTAAQQL